MHQVSFRQATADDIPGLATIRAVSWGSETYWITRITGYLAGTVNPQKALEPRIIYVALVEDQIAGFIGGHLTQRFDCDGELEWIDVLEPYRRLGIASRLITKLFQWFIERGAFHICVDPGNDIARQFYKKNGAEMLNQHWMHWPNINHS
ncbi:GNAT family N-acetyltransferase [Dinghuibacter silviterrae]|uniref:Ribosomal protein S18 acetylase RimI-like enzyme n=1 Tax=Dinghuibacter silviterrae TaxID=1539049 RepID=A0A4R8DVU2_9BACT|nr:GNAT family N-acetyltransferase [Dinghuibacter silviterrae]TDX02329.1 ribosomal protein S18 acetylase RimI-like enzyme [Dinghuibacter silviterrae]